VLFRSEMAGQGRLGDLDNWKKAEERWAIKGVRLMDIDIPFDQLAPFDETIAVRGFPLAAAHAIAQQEDAGAFCRTLLSWLATIDNPDARIHLARAVLRVGERTRYQPGERKPSALRFAKALVNKQDPLLDRRPLPPPVNLAWSDESSPDEIALLEKIGREPKPLGDWRPNGSKIDAALEERVVSAWEGGARGAGLLRMLALLLAPKRARDHELPLPSAELAGESPGAAGLLQLKCGWSDPVAREEAVEMMHKVALEEPVWLLHALQVIEQRSSDPAAEAVLMAIWKSSRSGRMASVGAKHLRSYVERVATLLIDRRASSLVTPEGWRSLALFERPPVSLEDRLPR